MPQERSTGCIAAAFPCWCWKTDRPSAIRRHVAFSEAVYEGSWTVEGVEAVRVETHLRKRCGAGSRERFRCWRTRSAAAWNGSGPECWWMPILAKKNLGTNLEMADTVIALGPGITAGKDAHLVIETMRGT